MKGVWRWDHTGRLAEYFNWDVGEPDNGDGEDEKCVMTRTAGWHDVGCGWTGAFALCQSVYCSQD